MNSSSVFLYGQRQESSIVFDKARSDLYALAIFDMRTNHQKDLKTIFKILPKGGVIACLVTIDTLENVVSLMGETKFVQPRFLSLDIKGRDNFLDGDDCKLMCISATKTGSTHFNERYHSGVLNFQPRYPRDNVARIGGVERIENEIADLEKGIKYMIGELVSIHSDPGDIIAIEKGIVEEGDRLDILYRTRPVEPPPSPESKAGRARLKEVSYE